MMPVPNQLRAGLPPLPPRIAALPIDARGYPVPWFVGWTNGEPDHRVADTRKIHMAVAHGLCWICGDRLGAHKTFVVGPMCAVSRTISEPPSHLDCARFAATACPFLTRPRARRRGAGLPDNIIEPAGLPIARNPGVVALWTTRHYHIGRAERGNDGVLFRLGEPTAVEWIAEGRPATRDEVIESVEAGMPILAQEAVAVDAYNARQPGLHLRPSDTMAQNLQRSILAFLALLEKSLPATATPPAPPAPETPT